MKKIFVLFIVLILNCNEVFASENFLNEDWWKTATVEDVEAEIANGADVNAKLAVGTVLMVAVGVNKNPEVIKTLIDAGANVNVGGIYGITALMMADKLEIVETLIKAGADVNAINHDGATALMMAVRSNKNPKIIKALIDAGADINYKANNGMTALMFTNNTEITKSLINAGADEFEKCGKNCIYTINNKTLTIKPQKNGIEGYIRDEAFPNRFNKVSIEEGIVSIGNHAFHLDPPFWFLGDETFNINLPLSLKIIGHGAFLFRKDLKEIIFPQSLEVIGKKAFYKTKLQQIKLPDSLQEIGMSAFSGTEIKEIEFPTNLKKVGGFGDDSDFSDVKCKLERVTLSPNTEIIDSYAFHNCGNLKHIMLPNGLQEIKYKAFASSGIESIEIPQTVKSIGEFAFSFCDKLKEIKIPNSLTGIGSFAFSNSGINKIILPNTIYEIKQETFSHCPFLKQVDLPNSIKVIGSGAFQYSALKKIKLSNNLNIIKEEAFDNTKLEYVNIPDTVEEIWRNAFRNTPLKAIVISEDTEIHPLAFAGTKLQTVYCKGSVKLCKQKLADKLENLGLDEVEFLPASQAPDFEKLSFLSPDIEENKTNHESSSIISDSIE